MYDSDLLKRLSVDPLSDKYPSLSPFMYCAGNPVVYVDPNGMATIKPPTLDEYTEYGISSVAQERFDAILHNIESFKNNETFMYAFMSTTGLSRERAEEYLTYGSGPKVNLTYGYSAEATDKGNFNFGVDIIKHLGSIDAKNANYLGGQAFGAAMVLIDEISHCGDMEFNNAYTSTGQSGSNQGNQRWNLSPMNHRGGDSQAFGFGVSTATASGYFNRKGNYIESGTVLISPVTSIDIRNNKIPNLPVIPTFNKQSIYSTGLNLLK